MTNTRETRGWGARVRRCVIIWTVTTGTVLLPLIGPTATAQDTSRAYSVLHNFTGGTDGAEPDARLIADAAGNLYGSTVSGGSHGVGVVFKLGLSGNETVLYTFTGGTDGAAPEAKLIRDEEGNLYGTTYGGGNTSSSCTFGFGCGVVFKLDPSGNETVLYTFTGDADGTSPRAALARDSAGNLYGTTTGGGAYGHGVVFKLDPAGKETVLHTFTGGADGAEPGAVIRDGAGNLYGTTLAGGNTSSSCPFASLGCGLVFKLDLSGKETVLYTFTGGVDGAIPSGDLVRDRSGNLFGTTEYGGTSGALCQPGASLGCGVVFKLDPLENETVLHAFSGTDGAFPVAGLIRDTDGNLYGTTSSGSSAAGTVFKLDPLGNETVLHAFSGGSGDGASPYAALLQYKKSLYGSAAFGGVYASGVIFKLE